MIKKKKNFLHKYLTFSLQKKIINGNTETTETMIPFCKSWITTLSLTLWRMSWSKKYLDISWVEG